MGRGTTGPSLTSAQETPPGTSQPVDTEGRDLRCPACPTSAPEGFYTEDSPSVTPSAPGYFFLPRTSRETRGYCQGLIKAQVQAAQSLETAGLLACAQGQAQRGKCSVPLFPLSTLLLRSKFREMTLNLNKARHKI